MFVCAHTKNVVLKPLIFLHGVSQLGSNIFQSFTQVGIGISEFFFLLYDLCKYALANGCLLRSLFTLLWDSQILLWII